MYQFFEQNALGHDFVCGDIHGCYDQLQFELDAINFNTATDRLFCVGDLIDRGPDSVKMLQLLNQPWFFSVMGNHEALMILSANEQRYHSTRLKNTRIWYANGGSWWNWLDVTTQDDCVDVAQQMPIIIEIQVGEKRVGLIHAEIMDVSWQQAIDAVKSVDYNNFVWDKQDPIHDFLWSRKKITKFYDGDDSYPVDGIDHVFHGHTILAEYRTLSNCTYIDTGCYYGTIDPRDGHLTIIDIKHFLKDLETR